LGIAGATLDVAPEFLGERASDPVVALWPGEHYRLLPAACRVVGAGRVVEVGTWRGESALALLDAECVTHLDTFDVVPWESVPGTVLRSADFGPRLTQHLADVVEEWGVHRDRFAVADVVFVD